MEFLEIVQKIWDILYFLRSLQPSEQINYQNLKLIEVIEGD